PGVREEAGPAARGGRSEEDAGGIRILAEEHEADLAAAQELQAARRARPGLVEEADVRLQRREQPLPFGAAARLADYRAVPATGIPTATPRPRPKSRFVMPSTRPSMPTSPPPEKPG